MKELGTRPLGIRLSVVFQSSPLLPTAAPKPGHPKLQSGRGEKKRLLRARPRIHEGEAFQEPRAVIEESFSGGPCFTEAEDTQAVLGQCHAPKGLCGLEDL